MKLTGLIAAPHTPFHDDGSLNLAAVEKQAEHFQRTGVSGAFVGGSTGEATSLTVAERCDLVQRWCQVAQGTDLQVVAHVGHTCQEDAIAMAKRAEQDGADAIAAFAPNYFLPDSLTELFHFLRPITESAGELPFYYYDIPALTNVEVDTAEMLNRAESELPRLAGIKATTQDLMRVQECLAVKDGAFNILFGLDEILLTVLPLGIRGAVGSTYNFAAPLYLEIIRRFDNGDMEEARQLQLKSVQWIRCLAGFGFMPAAKSVMKMIGVDCGPCRSPNRELDPQSLKRLKESLEQLGLFDWQRSIASTVK